MADLSLYEATLKSLADEGEFVHMLDEGELPAADPERQTASFTTKLSSMRAWCREQERAVIEGGLDDAVVFAGFQRMSCVRGVRHRYRKLSAAAAELWILGQEDRRPGVPGAKPVGVASGPLLREWFLVVCSSRHHGMIVARDLDGFYPRGGPEARRFRGVKTFRRSAVEAAVEALRSWVAAQPLDRELTAAHDAI